MKYRLKVKNKDSIIENIFELCDKEDFAIYVVEFKKAVSRNDIVEYGEESLNRDGIFGSGLIIYGENVSSIIFETQFPTTLLVSYNSICQITLALVKRESVENTKVLYTLNA